MLLLLLACASSKPSGDTATDTGATDTGGPDSADTSNDTGAIDTADTSSDTSTAPQGCALAGTRWVSLDPHECGLGPDGVVLCHWRLGFTDTAWDWMHSDVGEFGTWTCTDGAITGARSGAPDLTGTLVDPSHLTWDGLPYVPEGSVDTGSGDTGTDDTGTGDTGTGDTGTGELCEGLAGSVWESIDALECGRGGMCHWRVSFDATTWDSVHSDVAETGTWTCSGGTIDGAVSWGVPTTATLTDATHMTWAGVAYGRVAR
jgi:hypothetical protein